MQKLLAVLTILLFALPFASARTFYIQDDGTVVDPDNPVSSSYVFSEFDSVGTLQALQQRSNSRVPYDGGEVMEYAALREQQDDWTDEYLLNSYQRSRSYDYLEDRNQDWDWRHPIQSLNSLRHDYDDYRFRDRYLHSVYGSAWRGTDYYYRNRYADESYGYGYRQQDYRYGNYYDDRYRDWYDWRSEDRYCDLPDRYYGYCDDYRSNSSYRPYDWYAYVDGQYRECNGDDFQQYDCSYRWDGLHYRYALGPDDAYYYDRLYNLDDVDVSDRFRFDNGRYSVCPRRGADTDACTYYYKDGSFYYDDPSDNAARQSVPLTSSPLLASQNSVPSNSDNYATYYAQYTQFTFQNGQFVACTSGCQYYERDGMMFGISVR